MHQSLTPIRGGKWGDFVEKHCKAKWLQEGDLNTSFFHHIVAAKRRKNSITEHWEGIPFFFDGLYTKKDGIRFLPYPMEWSPITPQQNSEHGKPFTEEEICQAVKDLGSNKSPGPDGFTDEFLM